MKSLLTICCILALQLCCTLPPPKVMHSPNPRSWIYNKEKNITECLYFDALHRLLLPEKWQLGSWTYNTQELTQSDSTEMHIEIGWSYRSVIYKDSMSDSMFAKEFYNWNKINIGSITNSLPIIVKENGGDNCFIWSIKNKEYDTFFLNYVVLGRYFNVRILNKSNNNRIRLIKILEEIAKLNNKPQRCIKMV
jgi:hypothetical protein